MEVEENVTNFRTSGGRLARLAGALGLAVALHGAALAQETTVPGVDKALMDAAVAEGTVTVYCTQDEDIANTTARAFEEAVPGITVRVLRLASSQLHSRLLAEVESGVHELDVFCTPDLSIYTEHADWWVPLSPEVIPNMTGLPERAQQANYLLMAQGVAMLAYNSSVLSPEEAPKTWLDVLKPEFKGKGLFVDPRNSVTYLTWVDYMYELYGEEFLTKLKDQEFELVSAGSPAVQEVAAGGASFAFPVTRSHIIPVVAKNAPIEPVSPWQNAEAGTVLATGSEQGFSLYAKGSHPNAARVYLSWLLTPEAQKINCGGAYASFILPENDRGNCPHFEPDVIGIRDVPDDRRAMLLGLLGLQ
jgi:iron(III) transport system substrate-binding protein